MLTCERDSALCACVVANFGEGLMLTCIFVRPRSGRHRRGSKRSHTTASFLGRAWRALTATSAECKRDVHRYIFVCQPSSSGDGASAVVARATPSAISRPRLGPLPLCSDYWLFAFSLLAARYLRLGKGKQKPLEDGAAGLVGDSEAVLISSDMGNATVKEQYETASKTGILKLSQRKLDEFPVKLRQLAQTLRTLDLSQNKFTHLPPDIGQFSRLKQLNISQNKLTALPEELGNLGKLEIFNASFNQITTVPSSLSKLKNLKQVNLSDNGITTFPLMFCEIKHLDVLDLSRNKITVVPDGVATLQAIELILNQNQISTISERLADCPRLKVLRIEENCLQIHAVPQRILNDSLISTLAVEGNLFEMKQFADLDGYDRYMERYTAVKKKMF